ncbi:hypothetical protein LUZ63_010150 [Rhynchospora breviuscula]|uniref:SKP1-like protein n=1 Tax=Rhynchospora breviuscula TaxID=2022672 RepID=A0A9Q0CGC5_9POAL|nr:hypothetical protein LUZ63_010150 [Rhynchospora breviuscula]
MSSSGLRKRVTKSGQDAPESTSRQEFTANLIDSVNGVANGTSNQNAGVASMTSNQNSGVANGTSNQNSGTAYWTWKENSWVADVTSSQMSGVAKNQNSGFADWTWNQNSGVASGTSSQNSGVANCTWNQNSQVVTRTLKQNSGVASGTSNQISGVADGTSNQNSRVANGTSNQNSESDQIILKSCDGVEFKVPLAVAEQSGMVKAVMTAGFSNFVPLPTVSAPVVALMISFWTEHSKEFTRAHEKESKDQEKKKFFDEMDRELLFDFVLAANYMDAKEMLDSTCQHIADTIKNLPIEDVRNYFGFVNEFMPEEEQCVIEENKWAHE